LRLEAPTPRIAIAIEPEIIEIVMTAYAATSAGQLDPIGYFMPCPMICSAFIAVLAVAIHAYKLFTHVVSFSGRAGLVKQGRRNRTGFSSSPEHPDMRPAVLSCFNRALRTDDLRN